MSSERVLCRARLAIVSAVLPLPQLQRRPSSGAHQQLALKNREQPAQEENASIAVALSGASNSADIELRNFRDIRGPFRKRAPPRTVRSASAPPAGGGHGVNGLGAAAFPERTEPSTVASST